MAVASSGRPTAAGLLARGVNAAWALAPFYAANVLTLARVASIPLILALLAYERPGSAFWLFVAAAFTDAADGFVAKRFNGVTSVGAVLDPLADKLLVGCLFVLLAVHGEAPIWLAAIVVVRDVGLVTGGVVLGLRSRGLPIEPLVVGKASTLAQFAFLGCGLATMAGIPLFAQLLGPLQFVTAALTLLSAGAYGIVAWRCVR